MSGQLRVYLDPDEIGPDGYPHAWSTQFVSLTGYLRPIKNLIREQAGYRCERCGHPYPPGITERCPRGEWTPCDDQCTHGRPVRGRPRGTELWFEEFGQTAPIWEVQAQWRILTTHHLNGVKHDCRWWNLAALCQRCHLVIQGKVIMERPWDKPHTDWFKPHAAGYYASLLAESEGKPEPTREYVLEPDFMRAILAAHATQGTLL